MNLRLKILDVAEVTSHYVNWFKDYEVIKYSNNQNRKHTLNEQKKYVASCLQDDSKDLYGIFDGDYHIGNILITGLNSKHNRAEISFVLGARAYWNKGVMTFAVSQIIELSINLYKLNKLYAYSLPKNIGALKVLEKNNFIKEGILRDHSLLNNKYYDEIYYGLLLKTVNA